MFIINYYNGNLIMHAKTDGLFQCLSLNDLELITGSTSTDLENDHKQWAPLKLSKAIKISTDLFKSMYYHISRTALLWCQATIVNAQLLLTSTHPRRISGTLGYGQI